MIYGCDVSRYQGNVDDATLIAGNNPLIQFIGIKASDGITGSDPMFASNITKAKIAGLMPVVYHFYRPLDDPMQQLQNFLNQLKPSYFPLCAALDTEPVVIDGVDQWDQFTAQEASDMAVNWLDGAQEKLRCYPFLYGDRPFLDSKMIGVPMGIYPPWLAAYSQQEPPGWQNSPLWQYGVGRLAGINGPVDLDLFNGGIPDLLAHASQGFAV